MGSRVGMSVGLCCMGVRHGSEVGMGSGVGTSGSVGGDLGEMGGRVRT